MNRRQLIKNSLCGFAAFLLPAQQSEKDRFESLAATGLVKGETFYLSESINIPKDCHVINCRFIFTKTGVLNFA